MAVLVGLAAAETPQPEVAGWKKGTGWGWIWGPDDEVGALNAMTDGSRLAALRQVQTGRVYDLGVPFDRSSLRFPGHAPTEVVTFRSPEGLKRQLDTPIVAPEVNSDGNAWHSALVMISDNVGTQIDGLGHFTTGPDNHWYNGITEEQGGGDFGIRKCDAEGIPPIIARGVLIDVAGLKGVDALPGDYTITADDIDAALVRQKIEVQPGNVVLIRTGSLRNWGEAGGDHAALLAHDSAGVDLGAAKRLVEDFGAMLVGSDTVAFERFDGKNPSGSVHRYLLVEQGVHIGELHFLEDLARDQVWEFTYVATTSKLRGATAGYTMRPLALR